MNQQRIGTRVGPYEILSELGRGGMGIIYKARDRSLERIAALKFLPVSLARDKASRQRFLREARSLARVDHPNVPSIFSIDRSGETWFLACQYIEGDTLHAILRRARRAAEPRPALSVEEALRIAREVAAALDATHRHGIVHRDIKPDNIMIDEDDRVKVLDFGLAKPMRGDMRITQSDMYLGTPEYCSPEQLRGEELDARSDLYALGIVLYEMLSGRPPYQNSDTTNLHHAILRGRRPSIRRLRPGVPKAVESLIHRLIEKDRSRRIDSAAELVGLIDVLRMRLADEEDGLGSRGGGLLRRVSGISLFSGVLPIGGAALLLQLVDRVL